MSSNLKDDPKTSGLKTPSPADLAARPAPLVIIDGNADHRRQVATKLGSFYEVLAFSDYRNAYNSILQTRPSVVIVDEHIPIIGGAGVIERIRKEPRFDGINIIATSIDGYGQFLGRAIVNGANATLAKPYLRSSLIRAISGLSNRTVETAWEDLKSEHKTSLKASLDAYNGISDVIDSGEAVDYSSLGKALHPLTAAVANDDFRPILNGVKGHDNYSYVHSLRVSTLLCLFGHAGGLRDNDLLMLTSGGLLHDIGKMAIPHQVLNKSGRLTEDEWKLMQTHVDISVRTLEAGSVPKPVILVAAQHHERLDGSGYPNGLEGRNLNELARMAAIVDVFGALTDQRCYKSSTPPEVALKMMSEMTGHLDRHLTILFRDLFMSAVN